MEDSHAAPSSKRSSRIIVPSSEELQRQQAEEEAEGVELFFDPKRRKLTENDEQYGRQANQAPLNSASVSGTVSGSSRLPTPSTNSLLGFRSNSVNSPQVVVTQRPKFINGQTVSGAHIDLSLLVVHSRNKPNDFMKLLAHVPHQFTKDIVPDFLFGAHQCGICLTVSAHQAKPYMVATRISEIPSHYVVRILLVYVDVHDEQVLLNLNQLAITRDVTLILAFSESELARYIETYKSFENSNADVLKEEASKGDLLEQARVALSVVKSINGTDVANLLLVFGTVAKIFTASVEQLATVPGLGEKKILALYNAFHGPIITSSALVPHTTPSQSHQPTISSMLKANQSTKETEQALIDLDDELLS
jgi:DNA excision repair protein ERCC-1